MLVTWAWESFWDVLNNKLKIILRKWVTFLSKSLLLILLQNLLLYKIEKYFLNIQTCWKTIIKNYALVRRNVDCIKLNKISTSYLMMKIENTFPFKLRAWMLSKTHKHLKEYCWYVPTLWNLWNLWYCVTSHTKWKKIQIFEKIGARCWWQQQTTAEVALVKPSWTLIHYFCVYTFTEI